MTLIRNLALRTLSAVVRHARPEVRDWGMAMLREMDFIENDWAALYWAIGGVTVLFKRGEVPMGDLSDIRRKAIGLEKEIRRRTLMVYIICFVLIVYFGFFVFTSPNLILRIGSCLTLASILFGGYQAYHWRGREIPRVEASTSALTSFYRSELERQRDFHRGSCFWARLISMIPGYVTFCTGLVIAQPKTKGIIVIVLICFSALCVSAVPLNLRRSSKYQCQLNDLGPPQNQ